jgi:hypothetical protein
MPLDEDVMSMDHRRFLDGRLKLRHLVLVIAIAENGTLSGAAQEMHVTQPVVTRALREAESIVGVALSGCYAGRVERSEFRMASNLDRAPSLR